MATSFFLLVGVRGGEILIIVHFGCWFALRTTRDRPAGDLRKTRDKVSAEERQGNLNNRTFLGTEQGTQGQYWKKAKVRQ